LTILSLIYFRLIAGDCTVVCMCVCVCVCVCVCGVQGSAGQVGLRVLQHVVAHKGAAIGILLVAAIACKT